jgi:hypothetical protein
MINEHLIAHTGYDIKNIRTTGGIRDWAVGTNFFFSRTTKLWGDIKEQDWNLVAVEVPSTELEVQV